MTRRRCRRLERCRIARATDSGCRRELYWYSVLGREPRHTTLTVWSWTAEVVNVPCATVPPTVDTNHSTSTGAPSPEPGVADGSGVTRVQITNPSGHGSPEATPYWNGPAGSANAWANASPVRFIESTAPTPTAEPLCRNARLVTMSVPPSPRRRWSRPAVRGHARNAPATVGFPQDEGSPDSSGRLSVRPRPQPAETRRGAGPFSPGCAFARRFLDGLYRQAP